MHGIQRTANKYEHDDQQESVLGIEWHRRHSKGAGYGDTRQAKHGDSRAKPLDDQRADDGAAYTAEVPRRQGVARDGLREASSGQHRRNQKDSDVIDQQAKEERAEKPNRIQPEVRNEQIAHRG